MAIAVDRLTKTYPGGVEAVRGLDFSVASGEVFGLLGPNGAGKSTTVGILTTTVRPTSGHARLGGYDVVAQPVQARRISAVVFQDSVLDRPLTGRRNLEVHARLWGLDRTAAAKRIDEVSAAFDLGDLIGRPVDTYSGGERRRLEIARALLSNPRILFLDEPTVGLDPRVRFELLDHIAGLRAKQMTILLTTHHLDEAEQLCDRIAIITEGRVVALDTPAALRAQLGRELVEVRVDGDVDQLLDQLGRTRLSSDGIFAVGSTVHVPVHHGTARDVITAIDNLGIPTRAIASRAPTLDDVYLHLTGRSLAA